MFDHEISLDLDSRITVIHGPNGIGKTIVLRMIHELLSGEPDVLLRVPYQEFELEFTSGDKITVQRDSSAKNVDATDQDATDHLKCQVIFGSEKSDVPVVVGLDSAVFRQITGMLGGPWRYIGKGRWEDPRDGEVLDSNDVVVRYRQRFPPEIVKKLRRKLNDVNDVLEKVRRKCKVRLIGTDRLLSSTSDHGDIVEMRERFEELEWTPHRRSYPEDWEAKRIADYSKDLTRRFRDALSRYGALTEGLDRSFVRRLLQRDYPRKSAEQLLCLFKELDDKRREFTRLGLLTVQDVQEDVLGERAGDDAVLKLVSQSTDVFSLYVHDMQQKLALLDELQHRLQILRSRTDQRFQFKKLIIDPAEGFMFEPEGGSRMGPADLSSGEQHEMILFYYLLFMAGEGDLVLIDEPEISLHVEWQMALVEDITAALRESSIDVLIATHSPSIAQGVGGDNVVTLGPRKS